MLHDINLTSEEKDKTVLSKGKFTKGIPHKLIKSKVDYNRSSYSVKSNKNSIRQFIGKIYAKKKGLCHYSGIILEIKDKNHPFYFSAERLNNNSAPLICDYFWS